MNIDPYIQGLNKALKIIFLIGIVLFFVSWQKKDILPDKKDILIELYQEPVQTETQVQPFETKAGSSTYTISPLYNYELYGLVVSYTNTLSWYNIYNQMSKDYINTKDVCVIYGDNIQSEVYKLMGFKSDAFMCQPNFKYASAKEAITKYKNRCLSNNHLLAANRSINKKIMGLRRGDQIHIKGYLVKYTAGNWNGNWRASSTARDDYGCEVIFVNDIEILSRANIFWNLIYIFAKYLIYACLLGLGIIFFKPPSYLIKDENV